MTLIPAVDIPFARPWRTGNELAYIEQVIESGELFGAGRFNERCMTWLRDRTGAHAALTTPSVSTLWSLRRSSWGSARVTR